jgi:hypothetical protein
MVKTRPKIRRLEFSQGMFEPGADPGRLPVHLFVGSRITDEIIEAIVKDGLLELGGVYGNPEAGDPVQYDSVKVVLQDGIVEIIVYNRALALSHGDDETMRRIHRVLGVLEDSIANGATPLPLPLVRFERPPKTGRNEPCPCGSGVKYKKCCLNKESSSFRKGVAGEVPAEIREEFKTREIESLEDAQAVAGKVMNRRNSLALEEFSGLSPTQMHHIIRFPFESPDIVSFAEDFPVPKTAPMMMLFRHLADAAGKEGIRTTAKGNLPRKVCQEAFGSFRDAGLGDWFSAHCKVNKEDDFLELHVVRLVAVMAGLLRKYKGRFLLTVKGRKAAEDSTGRRAYFELFRTCALKFNWGYFDLYPDFHIIQNSFLYSLYLLHLHGDEFQPADFYGELFLKAFPAVLDEAPTDRFSTPRENVVTCHGVRVFERFAVLFGLAETRELKGGRSTWRFEVKKSPVLDEFIHFNLGEEHQEGR